MALADASHKRPFLRRVTRCRFHRNAVRCCVMTRTRTLRHDIQVLGRSPRRLPTPTLLSRNPLIDCAASRRCLVRRMARGGTSPQGYGESTMDQERFDRMTRTLASGQSRRGVLRGLTTSRATVPGQARNPSRARPAATGWPWGPMAAARPPSAYPASAPGTCSRRASAFPSAAVIQPSTRPVTHATLQTTVLLLFTARSAPLRSAALAASTLAYRPAACGPLCWMKSAAVHSIRTVRSSQPASIRRSARRPASPGRPDTGAMPPR
jgi:hypothetical protein